MDKLSALLVLPPFGAPGVCKEFDADCSLMTPEQHLACWKYDADHLTYICPFLD